MNLQLFIYTTNHKQNGNYKINLEKRSIKGNERS